jgi:hypothetical protein
LFGQSQGGDDIAAVGSASKNPLLAGQPPGHRHSLLRGNLIDLIGDVLVPEWDGEARSGSCARRSRYLTEPEIPPVPPLRS